MGNHHSLLKRANKKRNRLRSSSSELGGTQSCASSFTSNNSSGTSSNYFLRDSEDEFDRLQRVHFFSKHFFDGKNLSAPCTKVLEDGCMVLDIGCGSGAWALDCATEFQKSTFVGVDISPMFPMTIKPYNTMFIQVNALEGLPFESNTFEIVHLGNMGFCFTEEQWTQIVNHFQQQIPEVIRVIKPDGWIEVCELSLRMQDTGPCMTQILAATRSYLDELKINIDFIERMKDWLTENVRTVTDVQEIIVSRSVGGSKLGDIYAENSTPAMKNISPHVSRIMNITEDEYDKMVEEFQKEIK
ncbi:11777_t:CDS:2, partial [Acaulospora colombiana]